MGICLSIIIPVFNAAAYFSDCMDSILKSQGVENVEILIIDDGSTDGSDRIADDYSNKYSNIRVIHHTNAGPSKARNLGLMESSGNYVFFCDADDLVNPDLLSKVIEISKTEESDIILWDSDLIDSDGSLIKRDDIYRYQHIGLGSDDVTLTGNQVMKQQVIAHGDYVATVWIGAFKRRYLIDNELSFEERIIHEDELWFPQVLLKAETVRYLPAKLYLYRIHEGSITRPENEDWTHHIESLLYIYPQLYRYYDEEVKDNRLKDLLEENLTRRYLHKIFKYDFCGYGYADRIDVRKLWKTSKRLKDKVKIMILLFKRS